jgi:hypothetical protein
MTNYGLFLPGKMEFAGTGTDHEDMSAMLESLLLHTRVLHDFFCKDSRLKADDILASDFIDTWDAKLAEAKCPYIASRKDRLHKALAHLSTQRVKYESDNKEWDIASIQSEVSALIAEFKNALPTDQVPWFAR